MSRNTEYQFVSTDTEELESLLIAGYEAIVGISVQPASPERLFITWVANTVLQERVLLNHVGNQNIPSRAEGDNLDALGELFFSPERPQATRATCTMRFHISEAQETTIVIPQGTRVTDESATLYWETLADALVEIGNTYVDAPVVCMTAGKVGNGYAVGQINSIVDIYDYFSACANITETDGGSDEANDDEYYELMRNSMDSFSTAGAKGAYIYFAKSVSNEIGDVVVTTPSGGVVNIYPILKDGSIAGSTLKGLILAKCNADEVRPLTDSVSVEDPDEYEYNVDFTYYTDSTNTMSATEIQENVEKAVADYIAWQHAKLGRDINPSHLIGLLMQTGIKRVVITEPVYHELSDGSENDTPEIAKIGTTNIVNGGIEDE